MIWLPAGLGALSSCFLHARELWLNDLQWSQKTLSLQLDLMCPCSLHLKHMGPFLLSEEFGEMFLRKPLRLVGTVVDLCVAMPVVMPMLLMCLHGAL